MYFVCFLQNALIIWVRNAQPLLKPRAATVSPSHTTELSPGPIRGQGNNGKLGFLFLGYKIYTGKCLGYSAVKNVGERRLGRGSQCPGSLVPEKQKSEGELTGKNSVWSTGQNSARSAEHVPSSVQSSPSLLVPRTLSTHTQAKSLMTIPNTYGSNFLGTSTPSQAQLHVCTLMLGRLTTWGWSRPPSWMLTIMGSEVVSEAMHCRGPRNGHLKIRDSGGCWQVPTHS